MRTIQSEVIEKVLKQVDRDDLRNGQANNKQKEERDVLTKRIGRFDGM